MRLLNVHTRRLREFHGDDVPEYAILSHTWEEGEVSLQDLQAGKGPSKQGYEKIDLTCKQAKHDNLEWAWVDTCCIDKTSSAELSEAINSMYRWYKGSTICYAYLTDVDDEFPYVSWLDEKGEGGLLVSKWFTRAWTLQELIAPRRLHFYGYGWKSIGERSDASIARHINAVTRIPIPVIFDGDSLSQYSAAQKMSWAAERSSTRAEDIAYSLLGLFDINMPLLYGEGTRAFARLQEEILKETDDHSLLCWTVPKDSPRAWTLESVFAKSPDDFAKSGNIKRDFYDSGSPSAMTNIGLQIHLHLTEREYGRGSHLYSGNTACSVYDAALNAVQLSRYPMFTEYQMSIILIRTPIIPDHSESGTRYSRLVAPTLGRISPAEQEHRAVGARAEQIYIHKKLLPIEYDRFGFGGVHLQNIPIAAQLSLLYRTTEHNRDLEMSVQTVYHTGYQSSRSPDFRPLSGNMADMAWSQVYGCIKFGHRIPALSQSPESPYFVMFGVGPADGNAPLNILLAWSKDDIHFGAHSGNLNLRHEPYGRICRIVRDFVLDPANLWIRRKNCWRLHGEIARTRVTLRRARKYDTFDFILERENPNTRDGEAASNRLHFLIRVESVKDSGENGLAMLA